MRSQLAHEDIFQPYPANPSFRPPPPLSNDIQEALYKELKAGKKTIGVLANEYSVSKARIDAVRKLKEVEAEMYRQVSAWFSFTFPGTGSFTSG